jgi:transcriptional regulator with XRE-family HTH domain
MDEQKSSGRKASSYFAEQVKKARKGAGLTQQELANALTDLGEVDTKTGSPFWDQPKIGRIENGMRAVNLEETLAIAAALGVNPVHLIIPRGAKSEIAITSGLTVSADKARNWLNDMEPLWEDDAELYYHWIPIADLKRELAERRNILRGVVKEIGGTLNEAIQQVKALLAAAEQEFGEDFVIEDADGSASAGDFRLLIEEITAQRQALKAKYRELNRMSDEDLLPPEDREESK